MKYSVNAVIVTCNRCELLKKSIEALLTSRYELNSIIIINNASTDGTKEYLDSLNETKLIIIHQEVNEGGAGGFFHGIKEAYERGCDFVWIMDDDTVVTESALEELINGYEILRDRPVGFLASNVFWQDDKPCFMNICNTWYDWNEYASEGIIRVSHCSFVSMLIPSWVVKEVGYPIKEYFIWGDDGEYSTRILQRYEGYLCGKSKVHHLMNENIGVDIMNVPLERLGRFFFFYRNWMCTNRMRSKEAAKEFEKQSKVLIKNILLSNTSNKYEKVKIIKKGIKEGKKFQVPIIYPEEEKVTVNNTNKKSLYEILKYRGFRIFRYFGIKYDIKTQGYVTYCRQLFERYCKTNPNKWDKVKFIINGYFKTKLYDTGKRGEDLYQLLNESEIIFDEGKYFAYSIDFYKSWKIKNRQIANCTIDYEIILNNSLQELKMLGEDDEYIRDNYRVVESFENYVNRCALKVKKSKLYNKKNIYKWLTNILTSKAETLEEALQRILFVNQVMWQTRHNQMGLGRLDVILEKYITDDMTEDYLVEIFKDFFALLHKYYWFKSEEMPGDTGQIVILGGETENGKYVTNKITYAVIRAIKELQIPDPKILLRVSDKTSEELWKNAISCLTTGIGSPLFSNDSKVIPALLNYGYEKEDAQNYVTSACWEIIPGNSCEQNNIGVFDFAAPFDLMAKKENLSELETWESFICKFAEHLCGHVYYMAQLTNNIVWEKDPLLSFFKSICRKNRKDVSEGGCTYNNYGILSLALANTVNSLINIQQYVYREKRYSLKEFFTMRNMNFPNEIIRNELKNSKKYFGTDEDNGEDVIGLTNWLLMRVNEAIEPIKNQYDGHIKFGLSSPGYITVGVKAPATFDGRLDNEPYSIHISADDNQNITGLVNFASAINYGDSGFNGNVVDFMISPDFVNNNIEKFTTFMKTCILQGVFQMQINVVSYKMLMEARNNPASFPNLIVRVWGFSAYFKDLPEEYKDYIIERARLNEAIN